MRSQPSLYLLGGFDARVGDEPLTRFGYDKVRALFAYLAVEAGTAHRRERLAAMFWPEQEERAARHSLSQALLKLRKAVDAGGISSRRLIVADRSTVRLEAAGVQLDTARFEGLVRGSVAGASAPAGDGSGLTTTASERLAEAAALYKGDFLQGVILPDAPAFDEWTALRREYFHTLMLRTLATLAGYHTARAEWGQAQRYTRRQIALEPWDEDAHARLMRLLARSGDYNGALAQYERCRQRLAADLGVAPTSRTTRLAERIAAARRRPLARILPAPATPLVGRAAEVNAVRRQLFRPEVRLLTITGPGGIGKTRLAQAVAADLAEAFLEGICYVPLADVTDVADLFTTIAATLDLPLQGTESPVTQVVSYLADREMLLILDNFEQLLPAGAPLLHTLLEKAPELTLLVTTRAVLNLRAEYRFPLAGLAYSEKAGRTDGKDESAFSFFNLAARRLDPAFTPDASEQRAIAEICRLVQGMPLALELAAAWTRLLSCAVILERLQEGLALLTASFHDLPDRHRSMEAVLAQSWSLLAPAAQKALARLAVMRETFTLEAALTVTATPPTVLATLVDHSWIQRQDGEGSAARYLLHPLLHTFAKSRLAEAAEEEERARAAHSSYYLAFVAARVPALHGKQAVAAIVEVRRERANVRAAWRQAVAQGAIDELDGAVAGIGYVYMKAGWQQERFALFQEAVDALEPRLTIDRPAPALTRTLSHLYLFQATDYLARGEREAAEQAAEQAVALAARYGHPRREAEASSFLGWIWQFQARYPEAEQALTRAYRLLQPLGETRLLGLVWVRRGTLHYRQGELAEALAAYEKALALYQEIDYQAGMASSLSGVGLICYERGDLDESLAAHRQALALDEALGNRAGVARHVGNIGFLHRERGEYEEALVAYERALALDQAIDYQPGMALWWANMGAVYGEMGCWSEAAAVQRQALAILRRVGDRHELAETLVRQARAWLALGEIEKGQGLAEKGVALAREIGLGPVYFSGRLVQARLLAAGGKPEAARSALRQLLAENPTPDQKEAVQIALAEIEADEG